MGWGVAGGGGSLDMGGGTAEKQEEEELPSEDTDPADIATFIPVVAWKMTEKETIRKSVHHR